MAKATVDQSVCVGCEACVGVCPVSAISVNDGKASVDQDSCVECGACAATCPVSAISL
ncbi:indolepyruvate ferredoxin oxidoreductase subunit alpha [Synergistes jonesii]|uniref:Ferredoxin n=1 Tax=Synergistes jonesii TaxID=2754 RepID=A0A073IV41_9BACT|nr:4Fe-4S binding protein [Synergistes jonesii]KEJ93435.1 ferredoxin [Synergistes jonesii]MDY2984352.1 4Fe-4S binding protein [Synergistes jonesii]OFB60909.1 ferredoxin [Synergistes jonesii]OFB65195.1 ferredoxin [Synergistes jonesii]OFB66411.1 ferredoxin [Synergistes jonesii]